MLGRSPGFSTLVCLALAMAIGAVTTLFAIVHAVLLQPVAVEQDRVVRAELLESLTGTPSPRPVTAA